MWTQRGYPREVIAEFLQVMKAQVRLAGGVRSLKGTLDGYYGMQ